MNAPASMIQRVATRTKLQVLVPYLGEKVIATAPVENGLFTYPIGSVGTLDSITSKAGGEPVAVVVFDNCPLQDWVEVDHQDLMPLEFVEVQPGWMLREVSPRKNLSA